MINYRDFIPADTTKMLAIGRSYENPAQLLERLNAWVGGAGITVMNIETLLLPAKAAKDGENRFSDNLQLDLGGIEIGQTRAQVLRVWYRGIGEA